MRFRTAILQIMAMKKLGWKATARLVGTTRDYVRAALAGDDRRTGDMKLTTAARYLRALGYKLMVVPEGTVVWGGLTVDLPGDERDDGKELALWEQSAEVLDALDREQAAKDKERELERHRERWHKNHVRSADLPPDELEKRRAKDREKLRRYYERHPEALVRDREKRKEREEARRKAAREKKQAEKRAAAEGALSGGGEK